MLPKDEIWNKCIGGTFTSARKLPHPRQWMMTAIYIYISIGHEITFSVVHDEHEPNSWFAFQKAMAVMSCTDGLHALTTCLSPPSITITMGIDFGVSTTDGVLRTCLRASSSPPWAGTTIFQGTWDGVQERRTGSNFDSLV